MSAKPIARGAAADRDVEAAIDHYAAEGGRDLAYPFIDALSDAFDQIGRYPKSGSPRYALALRTPGLRSWPLASFPYVVFCFEHASRTEVWRVLHVRRDIPATLQDADES